MPMPMPFEEAWEKLVREKVDTKLNLVLLTKKDIESTTGNELRLMAKVDYSTDLPKSLQRHGYFILPVKNGEYVLVRGNGYRFDPRQSSYYRQAAEFLGLVRQEKNFSYALTDLGGEYVDLPADERRQLLAGLLAHFPPMRAVLELSAKTGAQCIGKKEIAAMLERHSKISSSTPNRRASTILAWLDWLGEATGAVRTTELGFTVR